MLSYSLDCLVGFAKDTVVGCYHSGFIQALIRHLCPKQFNTIWLKSTTNTSDCIVDCHTSSVYKGFVDDWDPFDYVVQCVHIITTDKDSVIHGTVNDILDINPRHRRQCPVDIVHLLNIGCVGYKLVKIQASSISLVD